MSNEVLLMTAAWVGAVWDGTFEWKGVRFAVDAGK